MALEQLKSPFDDREINYRPGSSDELVLAEFEKDTYGVAPIFEKGQRWLDLGANIGLFSLQAAAAGCHVEAFEPDPANYELLRKNVSGHGNIDIFPLPVTPEGARVRLEKPSESAHWQIKSVPDQKGMPSLTLRNLITQDCNIKMDVEGAEHRLILGTPVKAWAKINHLVMEYHLDRLSLAEFVKAAQHLQSAGLKVDHPKITPERYEKWRNLEMPFIVHVSRDEPKGAKKSGRPQKSPSPSPRES